MKGVAADWFDANSTAMGNNWNTGANAGNNFTDLFKRRFANETRVNQWYHELVTLRQGTNESVDNYATKFQKLVTRVGLTDAPQQKRMFLMGLLPSLTPLVYSTNPADVATAITTARQVEMGYSYATGIAPIQSTVTPSSHVITTTIPTIPPANVNSDVDELTKKLEQLTINYANLSTALLAQIPSLRR